MEFTKWEEDKEKGTEKDWKLQLDTIYERTVVTAVCLCQ